MKFTEQQVSIVARSLSDSAALVCQVDKDDNWKFYGENYIEEAKTALAALSAAAPQVVADELAALEDKSFAWMAEQQIKGRAISETQRKIYLEGLASAPVQAQEPVAHLKFWAAQSWSGNGNHDVDCGEGLEVCEAGEVGADKLPAFPVYRAPVQPVAVPDGWREKLVGLTVSMDVSTGEENGGDRIFGEIEEVMDDGDTLVLLAVESSRNFAAPAAQGDAPKLQFKTDPTAYMVEAKVNCEFIAKEAIFHGDGKTSQPITHLPGGMLRVDLSGWKCFAPGVEVAQGDAKDAERINFIEENPEMHFSTKIGKWWRFGHFSNYPQDCFKTVREAIDAAIAAKAAS